MILLRIIIRCSSLTINTSSGSTNIKIAIEYDLSSNRYTEVCVLRLSKYFYWVRLKSLTLVIFIHSFTLLRVVYYFCKFCVRLYDPISKLG
jgi:hypothetical protein